MRPLDRVLGLTQAEASLGLREAVCDLSLRLPFRQAAETAARMARSITNTTGPRVAQAKGRQMEGKRSAQWRVGRAADIERKVAATLSELATAQRNLDREAQRKRKEEAEDKPAPQEK